MRHYIRKLFMLFYLPIFWTIMYPIGWLFVGYKQSIEDVKELSRWLWTGEL